MGESRSGAADAVVLFAKPRRWGRPFFFTEGSPLILSLVIASPVPDRFKGEVCIYRTMRASLQCTTHTNEACIRRTAHRLRAHQGRTANGEGGDIRVRVGTIPDFAVHE